jgi:hypothetical protein
MTSQPPGLVIGEAGFSPEHGEASTSESALFIIWSTGRHVQRRIILDLERRFQVLRLQEIAWTPDDVMQNFRRFYADLPIRGVYHALSKGRGPFLAAVVLDPHPSATERETSRGRRVVNAHFLDAKLEYRRWGGELAVHCTETPFETRRDLTMLWGVDAHIPQRSVDESRPVRIERVDRDLVGARGWASEAEMFEVLNRAVTYVVTGAPGERLQDGVLRSPHVNLLTDDYLTLHAVLNARPRLARPNGGPFRVHIAGQWVDVRLRFVGDRFYDPAWAEHLLASRKMDGAGRYRPPDRDDFEALVYDLYSHRRTRSASDLERLSALASQMGVSDWPSDPSAPSSLVRLWLDRRLNERRYAWGAPLDVSVPYDASLTVSPGTATESRGGSLARRLSWWRQRVTHGVKGFYWLARDQVLISAPWLRASRWVGSPGPWPAVRRILSHPRLFVLKRTMLLGRGLLFAGRTYACPCCGWSLRGFVGEWGILASNHDGYCPRCNSKARHRRLWLYLQEATNLMDGRVRILEVAPWWAISRRLLLAPNVRYIGMDIHRHGPQVTVLGDATRIPLVPDSLDAALCIHTLEHIENDRLAMRELYRVLKPGGWAIVSVPLKRDGPTHENPTITEPADRAREFGERDHVRLYGLDIQDRLREAGFAVDLDWADRIPKETRRRFGLRDDENLFVCRKEAAAETG